MEFVFRVVYLSCVSHFLVHDILLVVGAYHECYVGSERWVVVVSLAFAQCPFYPYEYVEQHAVSEIRVEDDEQAAPESYFHNDSFFFSLGL